jgi:hypothetical protein
MKIGVKSEKITPEKSIDLAGFGVPGRTIEGVHDDIYLSVMAIEHNGSKAAIVCADIIGFDLEMVKELKHSILERFGYREEEVFFNASHTHSGPQTLTYMLSIVGKPDREYLAFFKSRILSVFAQALEDMEESDLYTAVTKESIGICRRLVSNGKALFAPNDNGEIDDNVTVLKFVSHGRVKAIIFNYACHPSTVGTRLVSADYPGCARKVIEDYFKEGIVTFYLQGCCGNIRGRTIKDGRFRPGTWEDVDTFGRRLGQKIIDACTGNMRKVENISILSCISSLRLPLQSIPPREYFEDIVHNNTSKKEWAEKMLRNYDSLPSSRTFILHRISICDNLMLLGMSGEVCSEYSTFSKESFEEGTMAVAAYTNGTEGYIPTAIMFKEGGYEPEDSYPYFSFPAPYDSSIEEILKKEIANLINKGLN